MRLQQIVVFVVEALHRRLFDRAVYSFDLDVGPGMVGLREATFDPIGLTDRVEAHRPGKEGVPVPGLLCELDSVVSENRVDLVEHGFDHVLQEVSGRLSVCRFNELHDGELGRPVDAHKEKEPAFGGLHRRDVDVKEADGIALEFLLRGLVAFDIRQAGDAMPRHAPMQR